MNWKNKLYTWLTLKVYFPFCFLVYNGKPKALPASELPHCPPGSLGDGVSRFLEQHHLQLIPGYEAHDLKHVLLGYEATFESEVTMQYFELGNGNVSLPVLAVITAGTLMAPSHWPAFLQAWKRGRQASPIRHCDLSQFIHYPLKDLHRLWNIR